MNITKEQRREAYLKLPPIIQDAIASEEAIENIQKIGVDNHLHIDQLGALYETIKLALLGFIPAENLEHELHAAGIDSEKIPQLLEDLEQRVFLPIKNKLIDETEELKKSNSEEVSFEDRANILKQIEDPITPVALQTPVFSPAAQQINPQPTQTNLPPLPETPKVTTMTNFIEQKMSSQTISTPKQAQPITQIQQTNQQASSSRDIYREPIE